MFTVSLTALTLLAGADPEPKDANATKIIARANWTHARADFNARGKDQVQLVLRSAAELVDAIPMYKNRDALPVAVEKSATADLAKALKVEDIDWTKQMLVVVSGGTHRTGGYRVEVTGLAIKDKTMTAKWTLHSPKGIATAVITHPGEVVLVPKFAGKVVFDPAK